MSPITRFRKRHPCHAWVRTWARAAASVLGRAMFAAMIAGIPAIGIVAQQVGVFYPNIPGELLLENEHVVVQRFIIEPGQWEGIHSHVGNQVYVHIRGGIWAGHLGGREVYRGPPSADGSVGWLDAIDLSEGHNSGNVGDTTMELVYVTLKACQG